MTPPRVSPLLALLGVLTAGCGDASRPPPFESVFDGRTLDGWVTTGGRYDGDARWSVEDGAIVGREGAQGAGGLLYTATSYRDFEIELEVFIAAPFDSGVFLRMRPDARGYQVTLDDRPGGEIGGLYSDGWLAHARGPANAWKRGAWNVVRVRCVGHPPRITAWVNGVVHCDHASQDATGFAEDGRVGLQVHGARDDPAGSRVMFRHLRVRRLE